MVITALASLIARGSLGTGLSAKLHLEEKETRAQGFSSLIAAAFATVAFVMLSGSFFGTLYVLPNYQPRLADLPLVVPPGLIGAMTGAILQFFFVSISGLSIAAL